MKQNKTCTRCLHANLCPERREFVRVNFDCDYFKDRDLIADLPCQIGDTIWDKKGSPFKVFSIEWFSQKVVHLHCVSPVTNKRQTFAIGKRSIGKTVFLSLEDYIAAKKMK